MLAMGMSLHCPSVEESLQTVVSEISWTHLMPLLLLESGVVHHTLLRPPTDHHIILPLLTDHTLLLPPTDLTHHIPLTVEQHLLLYQLQVYVVLLHHVYYYFQLVAIL